MFIECLLKFNFISDIIFKSLKNILNFLYRMTFTLYNNSNKINFIKSGGGTGPMKPSNLIKFYIEFE
ncbi:hypothetical protein rsdtw13_21240 [Clostridium sp. TW13]|uniref:Uncharacterized protein n=1 Tax=Inconstantimicrobium mannanitabidum TaxID=1604901 RepID=A0ACB5RCP3_9CLOT|nr:hypothetical protein rsdtw13_21240 [Clostridium sp. TW13]